MSTSEISHREGCGGVPVTGTLIEARIDPAHQAAAAPSAEPAADAPATPEAEAEQWRTQANQLAEHLRARQKDLDHREAELNARSAQLESDLRCARLWLSERIAELQERAAAPDAGPPAGPQSVQPAAGALEAKQKQLEDAQSHFEAERRRAMAEVEEQRRAVGRRAEHVDRSRLALEQLRGELDRLHRETLEIRLATEELWAQLSGAAPPAALVQSLARIRGKLAEHYRLANLELHKQKEELERVRGQLADEREKLAQAKGCYEQYVAAEQREAQLQASRLIARERQLDCRDAELRTQSQQWQVERCELQQELRRARSELAARGQDAASPETTLR
jgi:hypothetical protein